MFLSPTVPIRVIDAPITPQITIIKSTSDLIQEYSVKYNVSAYLMSKVVQCESHGVNGQSEFLDPTGPNGREDSWGIVQIHLPAHPEVTKDEALDREFSIEWMAKKFSEGQSNIWSCYDLVKDK